MCNTVRHFKSPLKLPSQVILLRISNIYSLVELSSCKHHLVKVPDYDHEKELAMFLVEEVLSRLLANIQHVTNGVGRNITTTGASLQRSITLLDNLNQNELQVNTVDVNAPLIPEFRRETAFVAVGMTVAQEEAFIEQDYDSDKTVLTSFYNVLDFVTVLFF
ncbi:5084_t:CDS:2 [Ambispora gerdemannii]|uniref:5084_t:CDS:1 n=1 Tax=Ambispora gerdemannii TaxID=144530 RepID=A0A9N9GTS8_9GLOM|nr:5084_t:CDS:2 [Ambispora gerdemannii]